MNGLSFLFLTCALMGGDHPLDALTPEEMVTAVAIMTDENLLGDSGRLTTLTLKEPAKADVLAWNPGDTYTRHAFAIVKDLERVYEGVIDLKSGTMLDWEEKIGVQPGILFEEISSVTGLVLSDQGFRDGLIARGLENIELVNCSPLTIGHFDIPAEEGRRLVKVSCFDLNDTLNSYAKPISGLYALVDLNSQQVLDVVDTETIPVPTEAQEYNEENVGVLQEKLQPTRQIQPNGRSFEVDGNVVTWNKWKFHYRVDKRLGLIISLVTFDDRMVMYQGTLSEVFVPYMDPSEEWFWKVYLDSGEYGFGFLASPLFSPYDVPLNSYLDDMWLPDDFGNPYPTADVVALFERNTYDPIWRHSDFFHPEGPYDEGRTGVELVVRMTATVGNYDYTVDWIFGLSGNINVTTTPHGIDQTKAVWSTNMDDPTAAADTAYGTLLAPGIVAVNHSHYFSYRLDLDIDGQNNTFVKNKLVEKTPLQGPRQSLWVPEEHSVANELEARTNFMPQTPAMWRFVNKGKANHVGNPVSYRLMPGNCAYGSLIAPGSYLDTRGEFTAYNLWVTPYAPEELFGSGLYVNQKTETSGLAKWTEADRNIENTDIVAWFTVGFHHVPRSEDWPVASLVSRSFMLSPFNFFDRNPAINLPASFEKPEIQFKNE